MFEPVYLKIRRFILNYPGFKWVIPPLILIVSFGCFLTICALIFRLYWHSKTYDHSLNSSLNSLFKSDVRFIARDIDGYGVSGVRYQLLVVSKKNKKRLLSRIKLVDFHAEWESYLSLKFKLIWVIKVKKSQSILIIYKSSLFELYKDGLSHFAKDEWSGHWSVRFKNVDLKDFTKLVFGLKRYKNKRILRSLTGSISGLVKLSDQKPFDAHSPEGSGSFDIKNFGLKNLKYSYQNKVYSDLKFSKTSAEFLWKNGLVKLERPLYLRSKFGGAEVDGYISFQDTTNSLRSKWITSLGYQTKVFEKIPFVNISFRSNRSNIILNLGEEVFDCDGKYTDQFNLVGLATFLQCQKPTSKL